MTLVAAVGALASQGTDKHYIIMVVIVIIGFWLLDAYYVMQERKYRLLYNNVTDKQENEIDFKMDTRNISGNTKELKYYKCIFSPSVICVYPVIGLAMVAFEIAQKFV